MFNPTKKETGMQQNLPPPVRVAIAVFGLVSAALGGALVWLARKGDQKGYREPNK